MPCRWLNGDILKSPPSRFSETMKEKKARLYNPAKSYDPVNSAIENFVGKKATTKYTPEIGTPPRVEREREDGAFHERGRAVGHPVVVKTTTYPRLIDAFQRFPVASAKGIADFLENLTFTDLRDLYWIINDYMSLLWRNYSADEHHLLKTTVAADIRKKQEGAQEIPKAKPKKVARKIV